MQPSFDDLKSRLAEIHDLRRAQEILFWDQTVMMPPGGSAVRGVNFPAFVSTQSSLLRYTQAMPLPRS